MNRLLASSSTVSVLVANARTAGACSVSQGEWSHALCSSPDQACQKRGYSGADSSSEESGRYGSRLLKSGRQEQFKRMRAVLGVQEEVPGSVGPSMPVKKVTISIFQSMKYLFGFEYKHDLAAYRVKTLGRELHPLLQQTAAFLSEGSQHVQQATDVQKASKRGQPKKG